MREKITADGINRRSVLKNSAMALAGISLGSGHVSAGKPTKTESWRKFERLLKKWEKKYGQLVEKHVVDGNKTNELCQIFAEFEFQDGTVKDVEYRWNSKKERLTALTNKRTFVPASLDILKKEDEAVSPKKVSAEGVSEIGIQGWKTGEGDAVLPASKTINSPPVLTPGNKRSVSGANSSQSWKNGFGVEKVTEDLTGFRGEAYASGAFMTYMTQAGVQVWYEFEVANESEMTTPSVQIDFDYYFKMHTSVAGGSADIYAQAFFNDAYHGDVITSEIETKSSDVGDYWNNSGNGSASFQSEVRPGGLYRFGIHVDASATAISTAIAKADVRDGDKEIDVGDADISWT